MSDPRPFDPVESAIGDLEQALSAPDFADEVVAAEAALLFVRTSARLLVCVQDPAVFSVGSALQQDMIRLASLFAEVHVVALRVGERKDAEKERLLDNLWLYPVFCRKVNHFVSEAERRIETELVFNGAFRSDIIIAYGVREAAEVARRVAETYKRPLQIHLLEKIFSDLYETKYGYGWRLRRMRKRVLTSGADIRVQTDAVKHHVLSHMSGLESQIEVLPQYLDLKKFSTNNEALRNEVKQQFPQYSFFAAYIGPLNAAAGVDRALLAMQDVLQYPSVGALFVGQGDPVALREYAEKLGVAERVIIAPAGMTEEQVLSVANVLLCPAGIEADADAPLKAVAAGVPVIAEETDFLLQLFTNGENALLCAQNDGACLRLAANQLLSQNLQRLRFARKAKESVLGRIEQDETTFLQAYKESIERSIAAYLTKIKAEVDS